MSDYSLNSSSPALATQRLGTDDLKAALSAGLADFMAAPIYGLFFASVYVAGGLALWFGLGAAGQPVWFLPIAAGFPLLAPFAAVGLYEVSRRREAGEPLSWGPILGALRGKGDGQLALMSVGVLLVFGFWIILARGIFAIFLADSGIGFDNLAALWGASGVSMLLVGTIVGGMVALLLFALTVISLPMLLDREVDFVTAMATSVALVQGNPQVMLTWAALIAALLGLAMLPAFMGLFIILPVLGHATWHLYRRAVAR